MMALAVHALSLVFIAAESATTPAQLSDIVVPLEQVTLTDSAFLAAQKLNTNYLTYLEPDRLLFQFYTIAGIQPNALPCESNQCVTSAKAEGIQCNCTRLLHGQSRPILTASLYCPMLPQQCNLQSQSAFFPGTALILVRLLWLCCIDPGAAAVAVLH